MKIFKYHTININLLQSLRKGTNWYSKLYLLNDPFECFLVDNTDTNVYKDFTAKLCACCFSKNMDEILMWSHYANNHCGVCLEFEITNEHTIKGQLINIDYDNNLTIMDNIEKTSSGHLSLKIDSNGKFLATKFKNWSYEEELRTYVICDEKNFSGEERPFLGNLTAIYFGINTNNDDIELVKHNTSHINLLKYYTVKLNIETMKIEILKEI